MILYPQSSISSKKFFFVPISFVILQCISWPVCFFTKATGQRYSFDVVWFNVVLQVHTLSFFSANVAGIDPSTPCPFKSPTGPCHHGFYSAFKLMYRIVCHRSNRASNKAIFFWFVRCFGWLQSFKFPFDLPWSAWVVYLLLGMSLLTIIVGLSTHQTFQLKIFS